MLFYSTNRKCDPVSLKQAVLQGLAPDGGLFMPEKIPVLTREFLQQDLQKLSLQEISIKISSRFVEDEIPAATLHDLVMDAINFPAPVVRLSESVHVLELFHGPTLAFKDFGARFMARLMGYFHRDANRELIVVVATSGDTGSAVAHGFFNVPGIRVVLLYPSGRVSEIQEKQLTTLGGNISALEIEGSFDDCQRLAKEAFLDPDINSRLLLTSANSINIGRLIPQCFYYCFAYGQIQNQRPVIVSVPSGNFGNLTAGLIVKKMGLPINRFIAATNVNDVVPSYLSSGRFQPRPSISTISNAMDVGNPSNFARVVDLYSGSRENLSRDLLAAAYDDGQTRTAIEEIFQRFGYIAEPHGAIGYLGLKQFLQPEASGIFLETAHPAKFGDVVSNVLGKSIEMPDRLKHCLLKPKRAQKLPSKFEDFKSYLLSS